MLDIAWTEFLLIGILALILIGPKELPVVLRTLGKWIAKARHMAQQFQFYVEDMGTEADREDPDQKKKNDKEMDGDR